MKPISSRAFTLVEVVIALAVVSFAVVTLLALIPTGMSVFQQAQTNNVETQIVQKVNTELQNASFATLFTGNPGSATTNITSYSNLYDMEGDPVTNAATSPNPPVYTVTMTAYPFTNAWSNSSLTNSSGQYLAQTVQFNVIFHHATNTYTTLVVNKGY